MMSFAASIEVLINTLGAVLNAVWAGLTSRTFLKFIKASANLPPEVIKILVKSLARVIEFRSRGCFMFQELLAKGTSLPFELLAQTMVWLLEVLIVGFILVLKNAIDVLHPPTAFNEQSNSSDQIHSAMPISQVIACLGQHGCRNLTSHIDVQRSEKHPRAVGGLGEVYRGILLDGTPVGLKCIRLVVNSEHGHKILKHTARELHIWSKCEHPNVQPLIGVAQHNGQMAMVSPWIENGDLQAFLARDPSVDRGKLCVQIADGVAYLHRMKIIHGDIKGANILMSQDHTPMLTDFGNSTLKNSTIIFSATARSLAFSLRWAAPELLEQHGTVNEKTDVYALGMTILETITGSLPYGELREPVIIRMILAKVHPTRPDIISTGNAQANLLWSLLTNCWDHNPLTRPTSAEVRDEMHMVTQGISLRVPATNSHLRRQ